MNLIEEFDRQVADLVNTNRLKDAMSLTEEFLLRTLLVKSALYSERMDNVHKATLILEDSLSLFNDWSNYAKLAANLASLYMQAGKFDQAAMTLDVALHCYKDNADCWFNYGVVQKRLGKLEESVKAFKEALRLTPNCALTHFQLGCALLRLGQFEEGLKEVEWRFLAHAHTVMQWRRYKNKPRWDGKSSLDGKRVLVGNEQGQGDAIMLFRYIKQLKDMGATIIMDIQDTLVKLFEATGLVDEFVPFHIHENDPKPEYSELPPYDVTVSLWSLMYHFDHELTQSFKFPYLHSPDVPREGDKKKIGIVWAGNARLPTDHVRSCPLRYFKSLATEKTTLHSLQKGSMVRDWTQFEEKENIVDLLEGVDFPYTDRSGECKDFADTARLIKEMDVLVSVDTAAIHLAGALNHPVVLIVPTDVDWRWQREWYPSVKVFKQETPGGWEELLNRVAKYIHEEI